MSRFKGMILMILAMVVFFTACACTKTEEPEPQEEKRTAAPVMVPYLNKPIDEVIKNGYSRSDDDTDDADPEGTDGDPEDAGEAPDSLDDGPEEQAIPDSGGMEEPEGPAGEPGLIYLGTYTITFYCPCETCCGVWATGCTASGVPATEWHTVAAGEQFDFGTEVYVDGLGYFTVEDRGVEGECLDVFVPDHQQALDLGLQYRDVYLVE